MTDNTQPEALALADEARELMPPDALKLLAIEAAYTIRRQHTRIAELEAELEAVGAGGVSGPLMGQPQAMPDLSALTERGAKAWAGVDAQALRDGTYQQAAELEAVGAGGVQALSAAPAGFVPVAAFDRLHAHAESLAARLLAAEQAAPKAAPGEQACQGARCAATSANGLHHSRECLIEAGQAQGWVPITTELANAGPSAPAQPAVAAPQQEAQEPVAFIHWPVSGPPCLVWYSQKALNNAILKTHEDGYKPDVKLYSAPQPAPAPLSEMPYEKRKAIQEGEQIGASEAWFHARHNMLDTLDRRNVFRAGFDRGWNAALAAQGGKDVG